MYERYNQPMNKHVASLGFCILALAASPFAVHAQLAHDPQPQPALFEMQPRERPMPMMRNDVRREHRRQGAKCMNAYPEDHGGFTSCIKNEREGSPFRSPRPQFMPMPPGNE